MRCFATKQAPENHEVVMKFCFGDMEGELKLSPPFNGFLTCCLIEKIMEFFWTSAESGIQRTKTYITRKMRCRMQLYEHLGKYQLTIDGPANVRIRIMCFPAKTTSVKIS